jgi:hypothetical protein
VHAMAAYGHALQDVAPKRARLHDAELEFDQARARLREKQGELQVRPSCLHLSGMRSDPTAWR